MTPSTACSVCNHLIHIDPSSPTGASPTRPCELWSEPIGRGFRLCARNLGTCKVLVFVKRIGEADFPLSSFPITLTDTDGSPVLGANGKPVTAVPYQPFATFDSFTDVNILEHLSTEFFVSIGFLCIRSHASVCPICDVEFTLTLSCNPDEHFLYKIANPLIGNPLVNTPLSISGIVQCDDEDDTIDVRNLRAQLVSCSCCKNCPIRVIDSVPIIASDTATNQGTYEFKNVLVDCFRVVIICTTLSSSGTVVTSGTGNKILASSECQLSGASIGNRTLTVDPISINCTTCPVRNITVTGQAVCSSSSTGVITNVTVQFIRCVKNFDAKCGQTGSMACGSPLLVTPTFTLALPADGKFSATIPEDCYLVRFVCTSSPTTVLTTTPTLSCAFFCKTTTSLGTITVGCTCAADQVALTGSISCSSVADGMTAVLIPSSSGSTSWSVSNALATSTVGTSGTYDFGSVDAGYYIVRILCTACDESNTDVGGTGSVYYDEDTDIGSISVNCTTCNTVIVTGAVSCSSGIPSNTQVRIYKYIGSSSVASSIELAIPNASTGEYSVCIQKGIQIAFEVVCLGATTTVLQALTTKQLVESNISRSFAFSCLCTS